jgi:hypothetical protein
MMIMKTSPTGPLAFLIQRFLPRLKFPWLFVMLGTIFLADLIVPDFLPFVDEVMLGLLTVLVGSWKTRREPQEEVLPPKDVTDLGSDSNA